MDSSSDYKNKPTLYNSLPMSENTLPKTTNYLSFEFFKARHVYFR